LLDSLIPVLGTLAGALIGGGVSVLTQRFTARYTREIQLKNMAEERARWAAETKLRELKKLYGQVADFLDATGELRRTQARKLYLSEDTEVSKTIKRWAKFGFAVEWRTLGQRRGHCPRHAHHGLSRSNGPSLSGKFDVFNT
jgi:hypothetical protein